MHHCKTHAGFIAILGRPNVGKSTLINQILGKKISITARKSQTTRHRIHGIKTVGDYQAVYVDTPGIHDRAKSKLNRYLNKTAINSVNDVDIIIFIVVGTIWREKDELILRLLQTAKCPIILVINKIDLIPQKTQLLNYIKTISEKYKFTAIVPLSAEKGTNVAALEKKVQELLPESPFFFPSEQKTDRDNSFLAAEIIREKLTRFLGEELPYAVSVIVDRFLIKKNILHISATIYVEREGQKKIVVGKDGGGLKRVGTFARQDMEKMFGRQVFLQLWVKVKPKWTDDERILRQLGYGE